MDEFEKFWGDIVLLEIEADEWTSEEAEKAFNEIDAI